MNDVTLDGSNSPKKLDDTGYELVAPGLVGSVTEPDLGASEDSIYESFEEDTILEELASTDVVVEKVFEIEIERDLIEESEFESNIPDEHLPRTRLGEEAIVLNVPAPQENEDMAILYKDEDGTYRWILPESRGNGSRSLTFHLPRQGMPERAEDSEYESVFSGAIRLGKRIVRVIKWVAVKVVGAVANFIARFFERDKYALFPLPFDRSRSRPPVDWDHMTSGQALLLCHGTMSSTDKSFQHFLPSSEFDQLLHTYEKRIFAFDHPTLSKTPEDNIDWLTQNLPKEKPLNFNILTTSRGGLVAREFLHRIPDLNNNGWNISIDRFVMSACPNRGTALAHPDSIPDLLDRYTNLLAHMPSPIHGLIHKILQLIKLLSRGIVSGLPGLKAQRPDSDFIQKINGLPPVDGTSLFALSADFNPGQIGLRKIWKKWWDDATDRIFEEENDGIVPTAGVHTTGTQSAGFPIHQHYTRSGDTHHLSYFLYPDMREQARDWLLQPFSA